jgi:hypothetical protein
LHAGVIHYNLSYLEMNSEEKIAYDYLQSEGYKLINYEPNGNVPPDFLIDGNIAIEVRRLNENYFSGDKLIGHYEEYVGLWELLSQFLLKYKNENMKSSYWLSYGYERPIPKSAKLKKNLKIQLDKFFQDPIPNIKVEVTPSFFIWLNPKPSDLKKEITVASAHDDNGGGAVTQIYISNIDYCFKEKALKIENYKSKYAHWWLILVDTMFYRVLSNSKDKLKDNIVLPEAWEKLIILDPESKKPSFVLSKEIISYSV